MIGQCVSVCVFGFCELFFMQIAALELSYFVEVSKVLLRILFPLIMRITLIYEIVAAEISQAQQSAYEP